MFTGVSLDVFFSPQASFHVGSKKDNLQEVPCYSWEVGIFDLKGLNNKIFGCFISLVDEVVKHLGLRILRKIILVY